MFELKIGDKLACSNNHTYTLGIGNKSYEFSLIDEFGEVVSLTNGDRIKDVINSDEDFYEQLHVGLDYMGKDKRTDIVKYIPVDEMLNTKGKLKDDNIVVSKPYDFLFEGENNDYDEEYINHINNKNYESVSEYLTDLMDKDEYTANVVSLHYFEEQRSRSKNIDQDYVLKLAQYFYNVVIDIDNEAAHIESKDGFNKIEKLKKENDKLSHEHQEDEPEDDLYDFD